MWTADIGCWEHGKNIDLPKATNLSEALKEAKEIMATTEFSNPIKDPYVVQIYNENGKIVFDYMNGGYYPESASFEAASEAREAGGYDQD